MKKHKFADGGIYTAEMGQPPMEPDGKSISPKPMIKKPMLKKPAIQAQRIPRGGMTRQGGKLGTSLLSEMGDDELAEPISTMKDRGRGLERVPGTGMKHGGSVSSASRRADGCAQRGKTRA